MSSKKKSSFEEIYGIHAAHAAWINPNRDITTLYLTDKSKTCKYHNKNLIETKIHTLMDNKFEKFFVLERRIYNRDLYSNVDMVKVKKNKNGSIEVSQRMLTDKEAKRYIKEIELRQIDTS